MLGDPTFVSAKIVKNGKIVQYDSVNNYGENQRALGQIVNSDDAPYISDSQMYH